MELTEQQAVEIAYQGWDCKGLPLKQRRHKFYKGSDATDPHQFEYQLDFYVNRSFDGHRSSDDIVSFKFSENFSVVNLFMEMEYDITEIVNKFLEQHNAGAGL